jgi:sulfite reductase alpha subunit-like flavoprotein
MKHDGTPCGAGLLKQLQFGLFGLGNKRTYPDRFQSVGRAVDRRLLELGAMPMVPRGEGDDNGG